MQEIIISRNEAGQRFDKYLQKYFKEAGSGFIYKMLRKKNIELNGGKASGKEKLNEGDSVKIFMSDDTIEKFRGTNVQKCNSESVDNNSVSLVNRSLIYEDENIILLNKPAGILSQKSSPEDVSVNEMIIDYLLYNDKITKDELMTFKPSVCNRLDRNTTGLISFGKTLKGIQELSYGFKERTFDKYYLAVVWGRIDKAEHIDGYLTKDEKTNKVKITDTANAEHSSEKSSYIRTYYEPLKYGSISIEGRENEITLLKIKLITGKTHQIRAHLASAGHGILGDDKYGNTQKNKYLKKNFKINFQLLHSYELVVNESEAFEVLKPLMGRHFFAEPEKIYTSLFDKQLQEKR